jgi:hypothetical protein
MVTRQRKPDFTLSKYLHFLQMDAGGYKVECLGGNENVNL